MQLGFIVILIIAIFVAIFAIQNGAPVPVDLFLARYEVPLAVVMMGCLILGAVVVLLLGTVRSVKKRSETKELKNKVKVFENDKVIQESNAKALEAEILSLKESNSSLISKVQELEEKLRNNNTVQEATAANSEINKIEEVTETDQSEQIEENTKETDYEEGSGFEINNEKSEANTNK